MEEKICPKHSVPLVERKGIGKESKKPYHFWSCPARNADNTYCDVKWNPPSRIEQKLIEMDKKLDFVVEVIKKSAKK